MIETADGGPEMAMVHDGVGLETDMDNGHGMEINMMMLDVDHDLNAVTAMKMMDVDDDGLDHGYDGMDHDLDAISAHEMVDADDYNCSQ